MNETLIQTLKNLRKDPTQVKVLYEQLYHSRFLALVRPGTEGQLHTLEFVTYSTEDRISELPIFTCDAFVLDLAPTQVTLVELSGKELWPTLLDIVNTGRIEAAVDPGQKHGIRLTKEMILGMISMYAES
jgi:hypothetical protein